MVNWLNYLYKREFGLLEIYLNEVGKIKKGIIKESSIDIIKEFIIWKHEYCAIKDEKITAEEFWKREFHLLVWELKIL